MLLTTIPVEQLKCPPGKWSTFSSVTRYTSGMGLGGFTTVVVVLLLICCISVVLGVIMFRRCNRQNTLPPAINQYRAIYNQGHVQSYEEGAEKEKSPYELWLHSHTRTIFICYLAENLWRYIKHFVSTSVALSLYIYIMSRQLFALC